MLVGATPGGQISYISPAYGGSTSDRQVVERSPLVNICDPGDSIMSDKGFNVQDLFAPKDVKVNIPTFFKKKNRMSNHTVLRNRKISSKRVHIERLIGLAKTFKILKGPKKKIFKFCQCIFTISLLSSHEKRWGPSFEPHSLKDALCQIWLKLAQWFLRRSRNRKSLQTYGQTDGRTDRLRMTGDQKSSLRLK